MKLPFLNRTDELRTLKKAALAKSPTLSILYGRRRCGKSRLLQQLSSKGIAYYLADQSDPALQLKELASQISNLVPGFDAATYRSLNELFDALNARNPRYENRPMALVLDEFPNLVSEYPALPGLIQKMIDTESLRVNLVLCGSSQRMMKGLVFNETAPLFGRAREIIKIRPLKAGWITDALHVSGADAILRYSVWGGVPRYWELAAEFKDHAKSVRELVLNRDGILHNEPRRLLVDDMRTDTQPHSLLAVIGSGVHRLSEIAARLGKPSMNLLRPLELLIELGLVKRDIPFGEREKNTKRTLYSISDPFLGFWYRYVFPNLSSLEQEMYDHVLAQWRTTQNQCIGAVWEDLARDSVPFLSICKKRWSQANRWWGKNSLGEQVEIDVVAESMDKEALFVGEAKWGGADAAGLCAKLRETAATLPFAKGKQIVAGCWLGKASASDVRHGAITPEAVLDVLR